MTVHFKKDQHALKLKHKAAFTYATRIRCNYLTARYAWWLKTHQESGIENIPITEAVR